MSFRFARVWFFAQDADQRIGHQARAVQLRPGQRRDVDGEIETACSQLRRDLPPLDLVTVQPYARRDALQPPGQTGEDGRSRHVPASRD